MTTMNLRRLFRCTTAAEFDADRAHAVARRVTADRHAEFGALR